jgi:hypothetical protein
MGFFCGNLRFNLRKPAYRQAGLRETVARNFFNRKGREVLCKVREE